MRSFQCTRCGLVIVPARRPMALNSLAAMADTLPLPRLPVMTMVSRCCFGNPARASSLRVGAVSRVYSSSPRGVLSRRRRV